MLEYQIYLYILHIYIYKKRKQNPIKSKLMIYNLKNFVVQISKYLILISSSTHVKAVLLVLMKG